MQEQARNMQRLVDDLLTLSALESEQNPPVDATFPVAPLLAEICAQARALSAGRHTIVAVCPDDSAALLTGARDELSSAFGNLVSNAVRYTPDGGTITLSWQIDAEGRGVSRSPTPAWASRRSTCRGSPSASIASTAAARARPAAPASASRSSTTSCCATRRSSRSKASPAGEARLRRSCRRRA